MSDRVSEAVSRLTTWLRDYGGTSSFAFKDDVGHLLIEIERLKAGRFTEEEFQNLCHGMSEDDACRFRAGCEAYQRKLFTGKMIDALDQKREVTVRYTNHRGETALRRILPGGIRFAKTEWHPEEQWLLDAWDCDKKAERTFALKDMCWDLEHVHFPIPKTPHLDSMKAAWTPDNPRPDDPTKCRCGATKEEPYCYCDC